MTLAERDPLLDKASVYFGRTKPWTVIAATGQDDAMDWFDVYKAMESLFRRFGDEHAFLVRDWAREKDVKRLNRPRIGLVMRKIGCETLEPSGPMEYSEARRLLAQRVRRAMDDGEDVRRGHKNCTCARARPEAAAIGR